MADPGWWPPMTAVSIRFTPGRKARPRIGRSRRPAIATIANRGASKTWTDTNGNGRVEAEELGAAPQPTGGWSWIDRDLTLHGEGGTLRPAATDARGVPDYRQGTYKPLAPAGAMPDLADKLAKYDIIFPGKIDGDGAQYFAANLGPGPGRSAWDRAAENRLIKGCTPGRALGRIRQGHSTPPGQTDTGRAAAVRDGNHAQLYPSLPDLAQVPWGEQHL